MKKKKLKILILCLVFISIFNYAAISVSASIKKTVEENTLNLPIVKGKVENAVSYKNNIYLYTGNKKDEEIKKLYYSDGIREKVIDDSCRITGISKKNEAEIESEEEAYIINLENGNMILKEEAEKDLENMLLHAERKIKKSERFKDDFPVFINPANHLARIEDDKFEENLYVYQAAPLDSSEDYERFGYINENGEYIDCSYNLGITAYGNTQEYILKWTENEYNPPKPLIIPGAEEKPVINYNPGVNEIRGGSLLYLPVKFFGKGIRDELSDKDIIEFIKSASVIKNGANNLLIKGIKFEGEYKISYKASGEFTEKVDKNYNNRYYLKTPAEEIIYETVPCSLNLSFPAEKGNITEIFINESTGIEVKGSSESYIYTWEELCREVKKELNKNAALRPAPDYILKNDLEEFMKNERSTEEIKENIKILNLPGSDDKPVIKKSDIPIVNGSYAVDIKTGILDYKTDKILTPYNQEADNNYLKSALLRAGCYYDNKLKQSFIQLNLKKQLSPEFKKYIKPDDDGNTKKYINEYNDRYYTGNIKNSVIEMKLKNINLELPENLRVKSIDEEGLWTVEENSSFRQLYYTMDELINLIKTFYFSERSQEQAEYINQSELKEFLKSPENINIKPGNIYKIKNINDVHKLPEASPEKEIKLSSLRFIKYIAQDEKYIYSLIQAGIKNSASVLNNMPINDKDTSHYYIQRASRETDETYKKNNIPKETVCFEISPSMAETGINKESEAAFLNLISDKDNVKNYNENGEISETENIVSKFPGISIPKSWFKTYSAVNGNIHVNYNKSKEYFVDTIELGKTKIIQPESRKNMHLNSAEQKNSTSVSINASLTSECPWSIDAEGNAWIINKGNIYKFENNAWIKKYKTSQDFKNIRVYDDVNLIAWDKKNSAYTTLVGEIENEDITQITPPAAPPPENNPGNDGDSDGNNSPENNPGNDGDSDDNNPPENNPGNDGDSDDNNPPENNPGNDGDSDGNNSPENNPGNDGDSDDNNPPENNPGDGGASEGNRPPEDNKPQPNKRPGNNNSKPSQSTENTENNLVNNITYGKEENTDETDNDIFEDESYDNFLTLGHEDIKGITKWYLDEKTNDWYLLDNKGKVLTGWWYVEGGFIPGKKDWYYLDFKNNGKMKTSWFYFNNKWFYLKPYSDGTKGSLIKDLWISDKGKWYYINKQGFMISNQWFHDKERDNKWYYLKQDGSMAVNEIINGYPIGSDGAWIEN